MAGRQCYHCKQWIKEDEAHDCWTTTEAALTQDLGAGHPVRQSRYVAFTGESKLVRKATGYEYKKLEPPYPASGSPAARAELPAAIRTYH